MSSVVAIILINLVKNFFTKFPINSKKKNRKISILNFSKLYFSFTFVYKFFYPEPAA